MDPYNQQGGSCSSNRRAATSRAGGGGGRRNNKHKQAVVKPEQEQPNSYRLFPEEDSGLHLHHFFAADDHQRQHPQQLHHPNRLLQVDPKASTVAQGQMNNANYSVPTCGPVVLGSQVSGAQQGDVDEQDFEEEAPLRNDTMKIHEHLIAVHVECYCAANDLDMTTSARLLQQAIHQGMKIHYAPDDALEANYYGDNPADADTTTIISPQVVQHHVHRQQQQIMTAPVMNTTIRLTDIEGQVAEYCVHPKGSRLVQQAIEVATPEEMVMVYSEITPHVRSLAVDVFGNYALQKILEYGPGSCKRKAISRLIGHVLPLSLHMYGCRVIQKALDVAEHGHKVAMAKRLSRKVLRCVYDQFANHVIQKCIECVPPRDIMFIFRSFCGKAKDLSTNVYGCHVIQRVLAYCDNPEIYDTLAVEIMESVNKLSKHEYANYVVQFLLEHGGQARRTMMVKKFAGRVVSMSYHKYASNVIEACLSFGSREDRRLITREIIDGNGGGGGGQPHQLVDMMINPYANYVIQKMVFVAEEE
ncbi:hypothetical protein C2845_PM17G15260 [Panicum miliaceum]|uniref:PUM-HD domain-containing protein n=1 Tax=Panicum miliaceum TaxID=4540 RepID=A0A3L6Q1P8_PANMI|nr:hypothetical protein C2845_PM17G15260 [Panicum miliaceum]